MNLISLKNNRKQIDKIINECMITLRFILKPYIKIGDQVNYSAELLQKISKATKQTVKALAITNI